MNEEFLLSAIDELDFDINSITGRDPAGYPLSGRMSGILPGIRYLAGYSASGQIYGFDRISGIWSDIRYLDGYTVSGRISGILPYIRHLSGYRHMTGFPVSGRIFSIWLDIRFNIGPYIRNAGYVVSSCRILG